MIVLLICSVSAMAFAFVDVFGKSFPFKPLNCERCMSFWFGTIAGFIAFKLNYPLESVILTCCPYICTRLINKILWQ